MKRFASRVALAALFARSAGPAFARTPTTAAIFNNGGKVKIV
jgi:hypothetical protein